LRLGPLQLKLPSRFDTIPSTPSSHAFGEHDRALFREGLAEHLERRPASP
jgi:hypothetical protein